MRRGWLTVTLVAAVAVGCGGLFGRDVVARANSHVLTVEELADILLESGRPATPERMERIAWTWLAFSLYTQRWLSGDSMLDSTTILEAMWPDVSNTTVEALYARQLAEMAAVDSAAVDSAYYAGEHRYLEHVLVRVIQGMPEAEQRERRQRVERLRADLVAGASWEDVNRWNDDTRVRNSGGGIGVVARDGTPPEFADAAFALEPGAVSEVVETVFGYHIIRRPPLAMVREAYAAAIRDTVEARRREAVREEALARWEAAVTDDAPSIMRRAAEQPIAMMATEAPDVIGSHRGGRFTAVDFVGWLQALPQQRHLQIWDDTDDDLREFAVWLLGREVLFRDAQAAGIELPDSVWLLVSNKYQRSMRRIGLALRVDSIMTEVGKDANRRNLAEEIVDLYVRRSSRTGRDVAVVPPFLARKLRREERWGFSYEALDRSVELAQRLEAKRDSAQAGDSGVTP